MTFVDSYHVCSDVITQISENNPIPKEYYNDLVLLRIIIGIAFLTNLWASTPEKFDIRYSIKPIQFTWAVYLAVKCLIGRHVILPE